MKVVENKYESCGKFPQLSIFHNFLFDHRIFSTTFIIFSTTLPKLNILKKFPQLCQNGLSTNLSTTLEGGVTLCYLYGRSDSGLHPGPGREG